MEDGSRETADQGKTGRDPEQTASDRPRSGRGSFWKRLMDTLAGGPDVTEEDIRSIVTEGQEQGVIEASEADMISNIFEFSDKEAQDIMTHRVSIVAVDGSMSLKDAVGFMLEGNNSRFPVYLENIDHIIGILHIRDAMKRLRDGDADDQPIRKIQGLLRQPRFVPETRNIDKLFRSMQSTKTQMVIVIDEYGQTAGLVSMEDILEEIVGNILDEYDEDEVYIEPTANENEFLIEGKTPLEDLEKRFGISFEEDTEEKLQHVRQGATFETLGGFMISRLDRIPDADEDTGFTVMVGGYEFKINKITGRRIENVLVKKPANQTDREE